MNRRTLLQATGLSMLSAPAFAQGALRKASWMSPSLITLINTYVIVAQEKGFFAKNGLDVTLQASPGTASAVTQVAAGNFTFGQSSAIVTCPPIANDGLDIVTVGQLAYRSVFEIASADGKPLRNPADWQGKTIGVMSVGGATDLLLDAMALSQGLDPKNVKKVVTGPGANSVAFLQRGQVDGFVTFLETRAGFELNNIGLNYLSTDDFARMPGDAIIASRKFADGAEGGPVIRSFLAGCREALAYIQDPSTDEEVLRFLTKYNPVEGRQTDKGKRILALVRDFTKPPAGTTQMACVPAQWTEGLALMNKLGVLKNTSFPAEHFYTNKFSA